MASSVPVKLSTMDTSRSWSSDQDGWSQTLSRLLGRLNLYHHCSFVKSHSVMLTENFLDASIEVKNTGICVPVDQQWQWKTYRFNFLQLCRDLGANTAVQLIKNCSATWAAANSHFTMASTEAYLITANDVVVWRFNHQNLTATKWPQYFIWGSFPGLEREVLLLNYVVCIRMFNYICQISIPTRKINLINTPLFFYSRALCQLVLSTLYGSNLQPSLIKIYNYGILVKTRTLSGLSMLEKKCACCIQAGIIAAIRPLMLCQTSPVYFHVTKLLMQVLEVACFQDFFIGMDYLLLWFWISQRIYWCSATNTSSRKRF